MICQQEKWKISDFFQGGRYEEEEDLRASPPGCAAGGACERLPLLRRRALPARSGPGPEGVQAVSGLRRGITKDGGEKAGT